MRWISENAGLKILSVAIALVIWVFVRIEERNEVVLRVPVRYANLAENLVVVGEQISNIQFYVEGPGTLLTQVERGVGAYTIDFADMDPGVQRIRVASDQIRLPRGVNVTRVIPSELEIELRETERYRLPVQAILDEDAIADGYVISNVEIEPENLEVVVAKGELDQVETLRTTTLPMDQKKSDWSGIVPIQTDGLHVKSITTREVEVFVQVVAEIVEKKIQGVPIEVRGLGDRYQLSAAASDIRVVGPANLLRRLSKDTIAAYVQIRNPVEPGSMLPVFADLPDEVFLKEIVPAEVRVTPR